LNRNKERAVGDRACSPAAVYAGMLAYRRFPKDLLISAEGRVDSLREAVQGGER